MSTHPRLADARQARRFPRQQARRIQRDVLIQVGLVLLMIESVFVAEELISGLLERMLQARASFGRTVTLMALLLPHVFELALPAAILIAVYRVALAMRENREFLMLSSLGIPPHSLIRLVLGIGLAAQLAALAVGGIVDPLARYAFRLVLFSAEYSALMGNAVTANRLFESRIGTIAVTPRPDGSQSPRLFVRQEPEPGRERVIVAGRAELTSPSEDGRTTLNLTDFTVIDFAERAPGAERPSAAPTALLRGASTAQSIVFRDIVAFDPRGRNLAELTTLELLTGAEDDPVRRLELGKRLGRSLLCLIAPLIAILGLSFTTRANQAFVLPLACAGLMAMEIFGTAALSAILWIGRGPVVAFLVVMALALSAGLGLAIAVRGAAVARPTLGRS